MKTIGQLLILQRKKRKLTLQDVQKAIKIHPKYLKALEADDYTLFEGAVHAKGFLKNYADFLDLNVPEILALWRRDFGGIFTKSQKQTKFKSVLSPKLLITPSLVLVVFVSVLICVFFGYLFYQYRNFTSVPDLAVFYPENNALVQAATLDITGKTDIDSTVFVNNQKLFLNTDGSFATSVVLKEGLNTLSIVAVSSLDKKTEVIRTVIYRPPVVIPDEATDESTQSTPSVSLGL